MGSRTRYALAGVLLAAVSPATAQTPRDSAHVRAQKARADSVSLTLDALGRWCNASYRSPLYLRAVCGMAKLRPDLRMRAAEDSLLLAVALPPVVVQPPGHPPVTPLPPAPPGHPPLPPPPSSGPPAPPLPAAPDTTAAANLAELPRVRLVYTYPAPSRTVTVAAGADLQAALDAAQRGDELVLPCTASWTGNYVLPAKPGSGWISVRTACLPQLPPIGTRVSVAHGALMPDIVSTNSQPAIATAPGASYWWLAGIEVTAGVSFAAQQYGLVALGDGGYTALAQVPSDIVLDRVYVHGRTTTNLSRCIALNSARTQISDSFIAECHGKGFDSQAILGWNGPGPYRIVNNVLQGAGENIMFGGSDPNIPGLVPSDIEIRRNHVYTPVSWKGVWTKKNLLELKNASRVLIEGNVFDGSWTDGQTGTAIMFRSANQDGGCRWCRTTDVTFRRNYVTHAAGGVTFIGGAGSAIDTTARRIVVTESVFDSIGVAPYTGEQRGFQLNEGPSDITIDQTIVTGSLNLLMYIDRNRTAERLTVRNSILRLAPVVIDGVPRADRALAIGAPGYVWSGVTLLGASQPGWPPGTAFAGAEPALAAQVRAIVRQATAGVVRPP